MCVCVYVCSLLFQDGIRFPPQRGSVRRPGRRGTSSAETFSVLQESRLACYSSSTLRERGWQECIRNIPGLALTPIFDLLISWCFVFFKYIYITVNVNVCIKRMYILNGWEKGPSVSLSALPSLAHHHRFILVKSLHRPSAGYDDGRC